MASGVMSPRPLESTCCSGNCLIQELPVGYEFVLSVSNNLKGRLSAETRRERYMLPFLPPLSFLLNQSLQCQDDGKLYSFTCLICQGPDGCQTQSVYRRISLPVRACCLRLLSAENTGVIYNTLGSKPRASSELGQRSANGSHP